MDLRLLWRNQDDLCHELERIRDNDMDAKLCEQESQSNLIGQAFCDKWRHTSYYIRSQSSDLARHKYYVALIFTGRKPDSKLNNGHYLIISKVHVFCSIKIALPHCKLATPARSLSKRAPTRRCRRLRTSGTWMMMMMMRGSEADMILWKGGTEVRAIRSPTLRCSYASGCAFKLPYNHGPVNAGTDRGGDGTPYFSILIDLYILDDAERGGESGILVAQLSTRRSDARVYQVDSGVVVFLWPFLLPLFFMRPLPTSIKS